MTIKTLMSSLELMPRSLHILLRNILSVILGKARMICSELSSKIFDSDGR